MLCAGGIWTRALNVNDRANTFNLCVMAAVGDHCIFYAYSINDVCFDGALVFEILWPLTVH